VQYDTDYFVLQNAEAMYEEALSMRYTPMDIQQAKTFRRDHHQMAIGFLNGELAHHLGRDEPAVNFAPFGDATLERQRIGYIL
jgi:hypothetical protein